MLPWIVSWAALPNVPKSELDKNTVIMISCVVFQQVAKHQRNPSMWWYFSNSTSSPNELSAPEFHVPYPRPAIDTVPTRERKNRTEHEERLICHVHCFIWTLNLPVVLIEHIKQTVITLWFLSSTSYITYMSLPQGHIQQIFFLL